MTCTETVQVGLLHELPLYMPGMVVLRNCKEHMNLPMNITVSYCTAIAWKGVYIKAFVPHLECLSRLGVLWTICFIQWSFGVCASNERLLERTSTLGAWWLVVLFRKFPLEPEHPIRKCATSELGNWPEECSGRQSLNPASPGCECH